MVSSQSLIPRWNYSGSNKTEGETYTKEIKYNLEWDAEIKTKAGCNIHGSIAEAAAKVLAKG